MPRKTPHFFIINPVKDRRVETRFEAQEPVQIRSEETGEVLSGSACEVGQYGMKLEAPELFPIGDRLQVAFPSTPDNVGCFGRVAWSRQSENGHSYEIGLAVDSWHGIVEGRQSWKKV